MTIAKNNSASLMFQFWDEECVVYNRLSGDVYLTPSLHAEILKLIIGGVNSDELIDRLISEYPLNQGESAEFLKTLSGSFKQLGLIDPLWN